MVFSAFIHIKMFCHRYSVEVKECTSIQLVVHIVVHLQNQPMSLKNQLNHKSYPDRLQSTLLKTSTWNWEHFWFSPRGWDDWQDRIDRGWTSFPKTNIFTVARGGRGRMQAQRSKNQWKPVTLWNVFFSTHTYTLRNAFLSITPQLGKSKPICQNQDHLLQKALTEKEKE